MNMRIRAATTWAALGLAGALFVTPGAHAQAGPGESRVAAEAGATERGGPVNPEHRALFDRLQAQAGGGNPEVLYNLGMFLNNGIGTARDNPAAFEYFQKAADQGHELAAYKVGCYHAGQFKGVVPLDEEQALRYKLRAAQAGYSLAQSDVGMHHARRSEFDQALQWWERASRQGEAQATGALAQWLATKGGAQDQPKAFALMQILKSRQARLGKGFDEHWDRLQAALSDGEKAEAERIRAEWLQGPSDLTRQARGGMSLVPALLARLEGVPKSAERPMN